MVTAMILFRRFYKVNAQPDLLAIVAAAKNPEITAIEARLTEIQKVEIAAAVEWEKWWPAADRQISSPRKTDQTIAEAESKVAEIVGRREELAREAYDLRIKLSQINPASLTAVRAALEPVRARAAQDIADAVKALYAALAQFNATSEALRQNGGTDFIVPSSFPIVDHFIDKVAKR